MTCGFCEEALSSLMAGIVALISFVLFPMIQIFFASCRMVFDKIMSLKNNPTEK